MESAATRLYASQEHGRPQKGAYLRQVSHVRWALPLFVPLGLPLNFTVGLTVCLTVGLSVDVIVGLTLLP